MENIKNKIEEKIVYLILAIINSKDSEINDDSCDAEYMDKHRILWEELSFKQKSRIKIKVKNFNDFEFEQDEPFYDKSNKKIYYKSDSELDEFTDILIEIFNAPKSLGGDFKYILTKEISKIKIVDEILFNRINSLWVKIDDKTKNNIINKLKSIGLKKDTFKFKYTQDDFFCIKCKDKTENDIQILIDDILTKEKLEKRFIQFDCETKNKLLIQQFKNKYNLVIKEHTDIQLDNINLKLLDLDIKKEFASYNFDEELDRINQNNIPESSTIEDSILEPKSIGNNSKPHAEYSEEERKENEKVQKLINIAKYSKGSLAEKIFAKFVSQKPDTQKIKDILKDDNLVIQKDWINTIAYINRYDGNNFLNLIISQKHTGAGFDVVGVENNKIIAYEIKAIDINNIYLYLTRNEINTFKRLGDRWRLIGVDEKKAEHIDLTDKIKILIDEDDSPLKKLNVKGFDIESLICKMSRKEDT